MFYWFGELFEETSPGEAWIHHPTLKSNLDDEQGFGSCSLTTLKMGERWVVDVIWNLWFDWRSKLPKTAIDGEENSETSLRQGIVHRKHMVAMQSSHELEFESLLHPLSYARLALSECYLLAYRKRMFQRNKLCVKRWSDCEAKTNFENRMIVACMDYLSLALEGHYGGEETCIL